MRVSILEQRLFVSSPRLTDQLQRDFHPQELMLSPAKGLT